MGGDGRILLKNIVAWIQLYKEYVRGEINVEVFRKLEEQLTNFIEEMIRKIARGEE